MASNHQIVHTEPEYQGCPPTWANVMTESEGSAHMHQASDIAQNYKQVKVQWTEQLVAQQQQKKERILEETEKIKAILDAEREKEVLEIDIQKDLLKKEGDKNLSSLENAIIKEREENKANVENYKKTKDAEANKRLYTKDFVRLEMAKALSQNTKFYFSGDTSPLGALLSKIMGESK